MRISHTERIVHITKKCVHTYSYVYTRRQMEIKTSRLCAVEELMHTCTYTYIHLTHVTTYIYIYVYIHGYIYIERTNNNLGWVKTQDASFEPRRLTPRLLAADGGDIATCWSTESLSRDIFCIDAVSVDMTSCTFELVRDSLQWPSDVQVPSLSTPSLLLAHPVWKGRCADFNDPMQLPSCCRPPCGRVQVASAEPSLPSTMPVSSW